jgi:hypothetical protein
MKTFILLLTTITALLLPLIGNSQCSAPTISGIQVMCSGQPITLTASSGYSNYTWSNGANTQSTTISIPGPYQVTVTCSNGSTAIGFVNVQGFTTGIAVVGGNENICAGQCAPINVLLTNSGNSGPYTIVLELSTGGTLTFVENGIGNLTTISVCPTETTTYTVSSVTNSQGCVAFINPILLSDIVNVGGGLINIDGPPSLCPGETGALTVTPNNANSYIWSNGASGSTINISNPGTYSVTATYSGGCTSTASIVVQGAGGAPPTIAGGTTFCENSNLTLTVQGGNYMAYNWSNGETTPSITINQGGTYSVTVTGNSGCTGVASTTITERPLPAVTFSAANPDVCAGACTTVTASFTGTAPFTLTYINPVSGAVTQTFSGNTGTFQVCTAAGALPGSLVVQATALSDGFCACD